jgi:hypothetical protein
MTAAVKMLSHFDWLMMADDHRSWAVIVWCDYEQ